MSWFSTIGKAVAGTAAVAAAITAAPVLGAAGAISTVGYGVAAAVGTGAAIADKMDDDKKNEDWNSSYLSGKVGFKAYLFYNYSNLAAFSSSLSDKP